MITQALGEIDYEEKDGTVEHDGEGVSSLVLSLLFVFVVGAFLGSMIAASSTVATVKGHYCTKYNNTQEYIACKNKPIQEIYALMEKP
jgi:hypothetical protein